MRRSSSVVPPQTPASPLPSAHLRHGAETGHVFVDAPYATPVWNGVNIRDNPMSELWVLLYAQVMQADGQAWRNVLLLRARAQLDVSALGPNEMGQFIDPRLAHGRAVFSERDIHWRLTVLGLPLTAPLSVLAVETLPEPAGVFQAPLDRELGQVRFLRTSTLVPVPATCPPDSTT